MADQIISIQGGAYTDIKKALVQWMDIYTDRLAPGLSFELYKNGRGHHLIRVDNRIDNELFYFLVNYLKYPEGIDYKIAVEGFTTIKDEKPFPPEKMNTGILVFIPDNDNEYDNVYAVTPQNDVFKISFGGKLTRVSIIKTFKQPDFDPATLSAPEMIHPTKAADSGQQKRTEKMGTDDDTTAGGPAGRFRILLILTVSTLLLSYVTFSRPVLFININHIIGVGVWFWLFTDYKMLRSNRYYSYSVLLSLAIFLYGYWLEKHYSGISQSELLPGSMALPIFLLAIQRPFRFGFKAVLKREPVVDRPVPSVADFIYTILLWMSLVAVLMWHSK